MRVVDIHEAKIHLSRSVDEVGAGAEIVIAKAGRAVARLVPIEAEQPPRVLGGLRGEIRVPDDFDEPLPEEILRIEG